MDNYVKDFWDWFAGLLGQRTTEKKLAKAGKKVDKALGAFDKVATTLEGVATEFTAVSDDLQTEIAEAEEELRLKRESLKDTDARVAEAKNTASRVREVFGLVSASETPAEATDDTNTSD
jgi:Tfp pilus assembly protein FimV